MCIPSIYLLYVAIRCKTAGDWDCVATVEHLPALHYSVDFIFLFFGIMGFILELDIIRGSLIRPKWPKLASLCFV